MASDIRITTQTFCRRVHMSTAVVRALEVKGILKPLVTDKGWRVYSERDVAAALKYRDQLVEARRRAAEGPAILTTKEEAPEPQP